MRRYSNENGMENGGTEMYERVFTTKGQGRYGKTKNSLAYKKGIEAWIHVYTLIMLLCVRGRVLDTYLHDKGQGTVREVSRS